MKLPPRYEAIGCLGVGGGGEVWAVRDRVTGAQLALKVLARAAGQGELLALVREATTLSGLEGLGVPRVLGFGRLPRSERRYLVRELVEGVSLQEIFAGADPWLGPLACAADQLTALHRAGLLHGDVKPANVIAQGEVGTLVDLGLAAAWREGGARAEGFSRQYAAPELLCGGALTVRAEVFSLGRTLAEGVSLRGGSLPPHVRAALTDVAARAMAREPSDRFPSTEELATSVRRAAGLLAPRATEAAWPVLGIEPVAESLAAAVGLLASGEVLALSAPRNSGRTTLARRLAWWFGAKGTEVVWIDADGDAHQRCSVAREELSSIESASALLVVDDAERIDDATASVIADALKGGARALLVATASQTQRYRSGSPETFEPPPLPESVARELLRRAMPSLCVEAADHLRDRCERRVGALRAAVRLLAGQPVTSREDVEIELENQAPDLSPLAPDAALARIERLLDTGRLGEARRRLIALGAAEADGLPEGFHLSRARLAFGEGDARASLAALGDAPASGSPFARRWSMLRARSLVRAGDYAEAITAAAVVLSETSSDAIAAEALVASGVAEALGGDLERGRVTLERAVDLARALEDARVEGIALGSLAIVHQRSGEIEPAKLAYAAALSASRRARDAATVAGMALNLAGIARSQGDLAAALQHLEAAVDMGRRAGGAAALAQATLHLANLDLYIGRTERARASIEELEELTGNASASGVTMEPAARAQLEGLRAELLARSGDPAAAAAYEQCARSWDGQGRAHDAAEARLERCLLATDAPIDALAAIARIETGLGEDGFREHEALAELARGVLHAHAGDLAVARTRLDRAVELALGAGHQERAFWALEARAKLLLAGGSALLARRDAERGLALLEETASRLPGDLREVFWNDPRRRALRAAAMSAEPGTASVHSTNHRAKLPAEDRLLRILEINRDLALERDLARLLAKVIDHAVALLGGERGFVVLVGDDGELVVHAARDRRGDEAHARFSRSVAERVIESGEPIVTARAREDARLTDAASVHQLLIQSIACVPVRGSPPVARTIGALYVETRLKVGARFDDELPTLRAFADQVAIAIENARLSEENAARTKELDDQRQELVRARDRLAEALSMRENQLQVTRRDLRQARQELRGHFGYAGLVGTSAAMRRVYALIDRVKDTDVPVLVGGESGTGKEVVARAIHQSSVRSKNAFLGVNCGAIPENLLEGELFGHVRGAFTGADRDRKGLFRECEGGTLLLDEIGELPLKMQAGLLRVLQERTVRPVGGARELSVDVRIVAATNRDLARMVEQGAFREDLFYRLHVVELTVPALRARTEDIPPLIDHFLTLFASRYGRDRKSVARGALRVLLAYGWPGNVRQLEHVLLNAWLMSDGDEIVEADLSLPESPAAAIRPQSAPSPQVSHQAHRESEKERILAALAACNWNRLAAAKMVGIPRRTFYRRLKDFGLL